MGSTIQKKAMHPDFFIPLRQEKSTGCSRELHGVYPFG
jgi:hypothetical protein